jgi:ketol-acid reductoisomerase
MDDIISGHFSKTMMEDWANDDKIFLHGELLLVKLLLKKTPANDFEITDKFYDNGVLMVAMVKAGVELAFEAMTDSGIIEELIMSHYTKHH